VEPLRACLGDPVTRTAAKAALKRLGDASDQ
jgi:hypothetical protein